MYELILGIIIFLAVLLVLIILAQNSKGGGLSSQFGGSGASNIIGVKKTGDLLEKLTWAFAIGIMVLTLSASFILPTSNQMPTNESLDEAGQQGSPGMLPPMPLPEQAEPSQPADSANSRCLPGAGSGPGITILIQARPVLDKQAFRTRHERSREGTLQP